MTTDELLEVLEAEGKGRFVVMDVHQTCNQRYIRDQDMGLCPICYLATKHSGRFFRDEDVGDAAEELGLDDYSDFIDAADHAYQDNNVDHQHIRDLRQRILEALGLEEPKCTEP